MAGQTTNYLFDYPTSTDYVKDGATAIETLADDVDATLFTALGGKYPGLRLIKKQTIGSGVSSVTVTGAFSATYDSYKIIVNGGVGSTDQNVGLKLGSSTTGYFDVLSYTSYTGTAQTPAGNSNGVNFAFTGNASANAIFFDVNVRNPFLAKYTYVDSPYIAASSAGVDIGQHKVASSYTDFTLIPGATLTGGTIYVYGYGAS
jgi:hypothetical protein